MIDWQAEHDRLLAAIRKHHDQRADDRCWQDDDELYAAAGLDPVHGVVGDRQAMRANCDRYIEHRCQDGPWPSYLSREFRIADLVERLGKIGAASG